MTDRNRLVETNVYSCTAITFGLRHSAALIDYSQKATLISIISIGLGYAAPCTAESHFRVRPHAKPQKRRCAAASQTLSFKETQWTVASGLLSSRSSSALECSTRCLMHAPAKYPLWLCRATLAPTPIYAHDRRTNSNPPPITYIP